MIPEHFIRDADMMDSLRYGIARAAALSVESSITGVKQVQPNRQERRRREREARKRARRDREKAPDNRFNVDQVMEQIHEAYDFLEEASLTAAREALHEQFGFGEVRLDRFQESYLLKFGQATEQLALKKRIEYDAAQARRR